MTTDVTLPAADPKVKKDANELHKNHLDLLTICVGIS